MPAKMIIAMLVALLTTIPAFAQDVNAQLIEAAQNGQAEKVQALLESGADVNAKEENGMTPLMWAAFGGDAETVQVLLDAGADVNLEDKQGTTAQRWAAETEIRQLLQNPKKAINTQLLEAAQNGQTDKVQTLLESGADVNVKDQYGTTALIWAAMGGHTDTVRALVDAGGNVNAKDQANQTALLSATMGGHTETVKVLLSKGADMNAIAFRGATALLMAARYGHTDTVRALVDAGADVEAKDKDGTSVLMTAERMGHTDIVELLMKAGAELTRQELPKEANKNNPLPKAHTPGVQIVDDSQGRIVAFRISWKEYPRPVLRYRVYRGSEHSSSWILVKVTEDTELRINFSWHGTLDYRTARGMVLQHRYRIVAETPEGDSRPSNWAEPAGVSMKNLLDVTPESPKYTPSGRVTPR